MADTYTGAFKVGDKVLIRETKIIHAIVYQVLGTDGHLDYRLEPACEGEANWTFRDVCENDLRPVPSSPETAIT